MRGDGGWRREPVVGFRADEGPTRLRLDSLDAALAYIGRTEPGVMRIVRADEEGGREVVG